MVPSLLPGHAGQVDTGAVPEIQVGEDNDLEMFFDDPDLNALLGS